MRHGHPVLGNTGTLDFGTTTISEVFRAATQDLLVSVPSGGRMVQIADLHLKWARVLGGRFQRAWC